MGSTDGLLDGGTIIGAAWRQPGTGNLSESVSSTLGLVLGTLYFSFLGGGASRPTVCYPLPIGPTPPPTTPEAWGSESLSPTHRPCGRSPVKACDWRLSAPRRFEAEVRWEPVRVLCRSSNLFLSWKR